MKYKNVQDILDNNSGFELLLVGAGIHRGWYIQIIEHALYGIDDGEDLDIFKAEGATKEECEQKLLKWANDE